MTTNHEADITAIYLPWRQDIKECQEGKVHIYTKNLFFNKIFNLLEISKIFSKLFAVQIMLNFIFTKKMTLFIGFFVIN